jgi:thiol-disulfide isomerase/thioredoxin
MRFLIQENELNWKQQFQCLYFYAPWFPFHQKMLETLEKVEQKYPNMDFFSIDTDFFKTLIKRFNIMSIPTIILFKDSKETKRFIKLFSINDFIVVGDDI